MRKECVCRDMVKREEDWWCLWRKMYKFSWVDEFTNINFLAVLWILVRCHFPRFVCLYCAHYCLLANGRNQPHIYFLSWNFLCLYSWIWDDPRGPLRLFITYVWVQRKYCPSWLLFFLFSKLFLWPLVSFNITPLSSLSQRVGSVLYMNLSFNPAVSIARGLCVN